ncbi:unnamed protein product, partial [Pylaiella littoralis]
MGFVKPTAISCALLLGLQQSLKVHAQATSCPVIPEYLQGSRTCINEGCSASDVKVGQLANVNLLDTCDNRDDTVTFTADLQFEVSAQDRYDVGLYVGSLGAISGTETGDCEAYTFGCRTDGNDDGDFCGDVVQGSNTYTNIEFEVDCDIQGDALPFPYCTVWANNGQQTCTGPLNVEPGTTSKCKCETEEVSVPVCIVFIEKFVIAQPDPCPERGETITVTIPASDIEIVGTSETGEDLTISVTAGDDVIFPEPAYISGGD